MQLHVKEFSGVALPPPDPDQHLTLTVTIYDDAKAELYHTVTCELGRYALSQRRCCRAHNTVTSVAALCSDASSAAAVPPGHVVKNVEVNAAFIAHHDGSPSRHFLLELSVVQRNSRGVELQCTSLGWAHLPLKPVPNIAALPLFLGSPRRIYTLNPLGLGEPCRRAPASRHVLTTGTGNLHNSMLKMGSVAAAATAVLASAADMGHQALQELLPELFIICASHGAHLNQVPGIRVRYDSVSTASHSPRHFAPDSCCSFLISPRRPGRRKRLVRPRFQGRYSRERCRCRAATQLQVPPPTPFASSRVITPSAATTSRHSCPATLQRCTVKRRH